jgi:hypothetical protein
LLERVGYGEGEIARVQALIRREGLGVDPEAQAVEDAACLVFLETQLGEVAARLEPGRRREVIRRTAEKMSPTALARVRELPLAEAQRAVLRDALGEGALDG